MKHKGEFLEGNAVIVQASYGTSGSLRFIILKGNTNAMNGVHLYVSNTKGNFPISHDRL